jgi:hypothetical protein
MVFSIIAGVISLMLLLLLFYGSDAATMYAPLIITVEVGLVAILITAVVRIYLFERKAARERKDARNKTLAVNACPDYWVKNADGTCTNLFTAAAGNASFTMNTTDPSVTSIALADYDGHTLADVCQKAHNLGAPWTEVRAECEANNVPV